MKHQYESEILFRLMERDGFNIPSSVPPYESEIKAYLINQVKLAYPKLTDYEAEWLLYNYTKHLPAEFPISSATNVTKATFENVVPFAYQSAILKGQTLVNLSEINEFSISGKSTKISTSLKMIKDNTFYTRIVYITKNTLTGVNANNAVAQTIGLTGDKAIFNIDRQIAINETGLVCKECINSGDLSSKLSTSHIRIFNSNNGGVLEGYEIIVEGDYTNIDFPYFDGIQSVKMPVLTTSNEDGTKTNILTVNEDIELRGIGDVKDTLDCLTGEKISKLEQLTVTNNTNWLTQTSINSDCYSFYYNPQIGKGEGLLICDNLPWVDSLNKGEGCRITGSGRININILKSKLKDSSLNSLNDYLAINPLTFIYELPNASIKTVDLKTVNESGESVHFMPLEGTMHVISSGEPIQPSFDMSVPVEATTQNLASFIDLEMEE